MKLPDIEVMELASRAARTGIPDFVKEQYDAALKSTGKAMWQGIVKAAASGFGKGALLTAGVLLAVMAAVGGYMGYADALYVGNTAITTFDGGLAAGLRKGLEFLTSGIGLTTLGIGGTLGAVSDVRKTHGRLTAEVARVQSLHYALAREHEHSAEKQPEAAAEMEKPWNQAAAFTAREKQRRAETARGLGI